jgi:hypothetical protein
MVSLLLPIVFTALREGYVEILQETENKIELEQYLVQNPILLKSYPYFDVYAGILANKKEWKNAGQVSA